MKKILAAVLCVVLLIGAVGITSFAANETQLTVTPSSTAVRRGDEVTVTVEVTGENAFTSMGYIPYTNSEYFTVTSGRVIATGTMLAEFTPADGGVLLFNSSAAHSGVFFEFTIKIKDNAPFGEFAITDPTGVNFSHGNFAINEVEIRVVCDHNFGGWTEVDANTHQRVCSICGASVDAPHAWDNGTVTKPASCKEPGEKTYTCECGATKIEGIDNANEPHSHGAWTNVDADKHQRECPVCGDIETADHAWDNGTVTKPASCKEAGEKTYACVCGATKTEKIDNANEPHSHGAWTKVDDDKHQRECPVCGDIETADHAWDNGTVTKPASCKEPGVMTYACVCGATKTAPIDNANEPHSHGAWTKVDDDKHQRECPVCGDIETADHAWDNGTVTTKPTCKDPGVMTYTCACGATKTAPIDNAGVEHTYVWSEIDADNHKGVCSVCADEKEAAHVHATEWNSDETNHYHACVCGNKVDVAAHEWDEGKVTEKATCDKEGVMTYTCACGATKTEKIAKIDHAWDNGKVTKEPTKNENGVKTYTCSECGETKTETINKTESADTGDKSPVVLFAALMVVAFGGIVAIVFNRKKFIV